jgi:hypothetical protein
MQPHGFLPNEHIQEQISSTIPKDNNQQQDATMRINQYISSFVFLHALAARAGEATEADKVEKDSWVMRIQVPVGSDYFIKTSNTTQQIDDEKDTVLENMAAIVPDQNKILDDGQDGITTLYHVVAKMTWDATNATEIGGRGFWVGRGGDQKLLQDLEKVSGKRDYPLNGKH